MALLLITNAIASIRLMESVIKQKYLIDNDRYLRAGFTIIPSSAAIHLSPIVVAILNNGLICGSL
ncbi:hypothetical protein [Scopulibacillus darangshiensis]|uniref:hypothetical protein n=1 Tax=Scopulibacillus darangshiensis TaxID=442528 RepID=UPI00104ADEDA|nr:hypothetical protein [Scopulibacillus darangshiensis]